MSVDGGGDVSVGGSAVWFIGHPHGRLGHHARRIATVAPPDAGVEDMYDHAMNSVFGS